MSQARFALMHKSIAPEAALLRLALALGAESAGGPLSDAEARLVADARSLAAPGATQIAETREAIRRGEDPLGEALCAIRPPIQRRPVGAFYTPLAIVNAMVDWVMLQAPSRVVDAGCGSGRFAAAVLRRSPALPVVAVDLDPVATLMTRAVVAVLEARGSRVINDDYTGITIPSCCGRTGFVSNPPYVRHHGLSKEAKARARALAAHLGEHLSGLAGLHMHFFLTTASLMKPGDVGCFITSAEWLDVGYGSVVRRLLMNGLGVRGIHRVTPSAAPFDDSMATAVITCFEAGLSEDKVCLRSIQDPGEIESLKAGNPIERTVLVRANRWSPLFAPASESPRGGASVLGDRVRVHRGIATGANGFFVMTKERARWLGLDRWCHPVISRAEEILESGGVVRDGPERLVVLALPPDIDRQGHPQVDTYLRQGEQPEPRTGRSVAGGYLASHRKPWWNLGVLPTPPIIASYMARRPPAFALNPDGMTILNIAHGLYPISTLSDAELRSLVHHLNSCGRAFQGKGRTYQGGLEKFEPREMEQLPVPWDELPVHGT